jgi:photosystem II stability/assembly factor-like uncharacterized protein
VIVPHLERLCFCLLLIGTGCPSDPEPIATDPWGEAFPARDFGWILGVWGPPGGPTYAVGGAPDAGRIQRHDGAAWSEFPIGLDAPLLNWAHGFSDQDFTVVGNHGTILHYDGQHFTQSATVTDQNLWGIFGASPDDLWAVGGDGFLDGQATILRNQGQGWSKVQVPALQHPDVFAFYKVWGSAADDVYIVGQRGVVLHWDGAALTELFVGTGEDLVTVYGLSKDRVAIVGGRANGELITWDGVAWKREQLIPLPGLNAVWFRDPNQIHVGGQSGTLATFDWTTRKYVQEETDTNLDIHALFGDGSGRLFAVGGSLLSSRAPYLGLALTRGLDDGE